MAASTSDRLPAVQDASDSDIWRRLRTEACRVFEAPVMIFSDEGARRVALRVLGMLVRHPLPTRPRP